MEIRNSVWHDGPHCLWDYIIHTSLVQGCTFHSQSPNLKYAKAARLSERSKHLSSLTKALEVFQERPSETETPDMTNDFTSLVHSDPHPSALP